MDTVAIYCRLSDEDQFKANREDDSESIINQKMLLTEYAIEQGWHIYKVYSDDDYSGLDKDRPSFNAMIGDAEAGIFNIVLCKTQSRFTRDMELVEKYLHGKFLEWGVRFVGLVDHVDTAVKGNKKSRQINGLINEWYSEDLSENIRSVFKSKMKQGQYLGAFAPYGYKKDPEDNHRIIIDEEAAVVVRKIFDLYIGGCGTHTIAQTLNRLGYEKPTVYKQKQGLNYTAYNCSPHGLWGHTTINRILRNDVYIGTLTQGKVTTASYKSSKRLYMDKQDWIVIRYNHEPIIDERTFYIAQDSLNRRRTSGKQGKSHIFAGKVRCLDCGGTMIKSSTNTRNNKDKSYHYLKCNHYVKSTGELCPTSHRINFLVLQSCVEAELQKIIHDFMGDEQNVCKVVSKIRCDDSHKRDIDRMEKELRSIETKIEERNSAFAELYIDKTRGQITGDQYTVIFNTLKKEIEQFTTQKEAITNEIVIRRELEKQRANIRQITQDFALEGLTHEIVQTAIDYIEIGERRENQPQKIKIYWNF